MTHRMEGFAGFPDDTSSPTEVPGEFFTELLAAIDDLAELKVTLYILWLAQRKSGRFPYVHQAELERDQRFMDALGHTSTDAAQAVTRGLESAVARGTLLLLEGRASGSGERYYVINNRQGREAIRLAQSGEWAPSEASQGPRLEAERPNIFRLYEQNLGMLTPLLAETLRDAQATYPWSWIEDAVRIAVANNVRRWRYVEAILKDWETKGRDEREDRRDPEASRRRYTEGEFSEFIEH